MKLGKKEVKALEKHLWKLLKGGQATARYEEVSMPLFGMYGHDVRFWKALGAVTENTLKSHDVALSAIVINQDGYPGADFYPLIGLTKPAKSRELPYQHMKEWVHHVAKASKIAGKL